MTARSDREKTLSQDDLAHFADAVVAAFPDKDLLFSVLLKAWGVRVSDIVYTEKAGKLVVSDLVDWSHAQGRALDMLDLVWSEVQSQVRPLQTLAGRLLVSDASPVPRLPVTGNLVIGDNNPLESMVSALPEVSQVAKLGEDLLGRIRSGLCVIEGDGQPRATGFLVGKRNVLTTYSAVPDLITANSDAIRLLFDAGPDSERQPIAVKKGKAWVAAFRDHGDINSLSREGEAHALDFVLVRLEEDIGQGRHIFSLPTTVPIATPGEQVFVMQFAQARHLKFSPGALLKYSGEGTRIDYTADTEPGSAGAPVVTSVGDLIAMHHVKKNSGAGQGAISRGVPVWRIRAAIAESNLDPDDL